MNSTHTEFKLTLKGSNRNVFKIANIDIFQKKSAIQPKMNKFWGNCQKNSIAHKNIPDIIGQNGCDIHNQRAKISLEIGFLSNP